MKELKNIFPVKYWDEGVIQKLVVLAGGLRDPWTPGGEAAAPGRFQKEQGIGFGKPKPEASGSSLVSLFPSFRFSATSEMPVQGSFFVRPYSHGLRAGLTTSPGVHYCTGILADPTTLSSQGAEMFSEIQAWQVPGSARNTRMLMCTHDRPISEIP